MEEVGLHPHEREGHSAGICCEGFHECHYVWHNDPSEHRTEHGHQIGLVSHDSLGREGLGQLAAWLSGISQGLLPEYYSNGSLGHHLGLLVANRWHVGLKIIGDSASPYKNEPLPIDAQLLLQLEQPTSAAYSNHSGIADY